MIAKLKALKNEIILWLSKLICPQHETKIMQTEVAGIKLLVLANEDVGREIAFLKSYEARDAAFLSRLIEPEHVCLDIGANTGYYTMLMASRATRGQVHSFEPVLLNWHLLNCGVILNAYTNVCLNNFALGDRAGTTEFSQSTDAAYSSLLPGTRKAQVRKFITKIETLDRYTATSGIRRVDVVKLDVEGAEGMVIRGGLSVFGSAARRPRIAMIELFDQNLAPFGTNVRQMVALMAEFGYTPFYIAQHGGPRRFEEQHHNRYYNVFFAAADFRPEGIKELCAPCRRAP